MSCLANAFAVLLAVTTAHASDEGTLSEVREQAPVTVKAQQTPRTLKREKNIRTSLRKSASFTSRN